MVCEKHAADHTLTAHARTPTHSHILWQCLGDTRKLQKDRNNVEEQPDYVNTPAHHFTDADGSAYLICHRFLRPFLTQSSQRFVSPPPTTLKIKTQNHVPPPSTPKYIVRIQRLSKHLCFFA